MQQHTQVARDAGMIAPGFWEGLVNGCCTSLPRVKQDTRLKTPQGRRLANAQFNLPSAAEDASARASLSEFQSADTNECASSSSASGNNSTGPSRVPRGASAPSDPSNTLLMKPTLQKRQGSAGLKRQGSAGLGSQLPWFHVRSPIHMQGKVDPQRKAYGQYKLKHTESV